MFLWTVTKLQNFCDCGLMFSSVCGYCKVLCLDLCCGEIGDGGSFQEDNGKCFEREEKTWSM